MLLKMDKKLDINSNKMDEKINGLKKQIKQNEKAIGNKMDNIKEDVQEFNLIN